MFWNKTITLKAYTYRKEVYDFAKVVEARKVKPSFLDTVPKYKDINPPFDGSMPNIRGCHGFNNLTSKGFIIPMWTDMAVSLTPQGDASVQFADRVTTTDYHPPEQRGSFANPDEYQHIKIESPWLFQCDYDIDWVWQQPSYHMEGFKDYMVLPGAVNYSKVNATHINLLAYRGGNFKQFMVYYKTPMVHLIPLTEKKVKVELELISKADWEQMYDGGMPLSFKSSLQKTTKKCPFSN